jgi:purine operon repressor
LESPRSKNTLDATKIVPEWLRVAAEKDHTHREKWKALYRVPVAKALIQEMKDTSRILDLKYKLMTIELLNLAKQRFTYRELSAMVHLPETVLSRYVKGHVLPTAERAEEINKTLQKYMSLDRELLERIHFDDGGYFDNTAIIGDTMLLERAVQHAVGKFAGKRVTKIMTAAVDGIPLATLLAHRLGVGLLVAKKAREVGVREFIEEIFVPPKTAVVLSLFVPRDAIKKTDCVLIVDDIIDSGETQRAMMKIIQKAKAEVIGIYALVSIGSDWKARIESAGNVPVEVVTPVIKKEPKEKERESRETREVREISA